MIDLKTILKGNIVILCLGNIERGDDGVGPYISNAIKGKTSPSWGRLNVPYLGGRGKGEGGKLEVIDAGVTPENWTGVIKRLRPDTILIIDAVHFEGVPGEIKLWTGEDIRSGKISTHDVSPKLLIEYLKTSTNANIHLLGIKPKSNKFGEGLSKEVIEAVGRVEKLILDIVV